jgi:hypothetical protein
MKIEYFGVGAGQSWTAVVRVEGSIVHELGGMPNQRAAERVAQAFAECPERWNTTESIKHRCIYEMRRDGCEIVRGGE